MKFFLVQLLFCKNSFALHNVVWIIAQKVYFWESINLHHKWHILSIGVCTIFCKHVSSFIDIKYECVYCIVYQHNAFSNKWKPCHNQLSCMTDRTQRKRKFIQVVPNKRPEAGQWPDKWTEHWKVNQIMPQLINYSGHSPTKFTYFTKFIFNKKGNSAEALEKCHKPNW